MEIPPIAVFSALLFLAVVRSDATSSRSAEEYWHSIWPHTDMPLNLHYLLEGVNNGEIEDTQYPDTTFLEDDLHAGKQMNIKFKNHHSTNQEKLASTQPYWVNGWKRNIMDEDQKSQPYWVNGWKRNTMDENQKIQPYWVNGWKRTTMDEDQKSQPYWVNGWKRTTMDEDQKIQPYWVNGWKRNTMDENQKIQPYWVNGWKRNTMDEDQKIQPYWVNGWKRNTMDEDQKIQPYWVNGWKRSIRGEDQKSQPYWVNGWKRSIRDEDQKSQPYWVNGWKRNRMDEDSYIPKKVTMEEICNGKNFVGEDDKFCAESVESIVDFVISKLGKDIVALTSSFIPHQTQYKILEGVQRVSSEGVMCHNMNFEKPGFYCHQVNATITYSVPMEAVDGRRTSVVALCHHDTRGLEPHMLFRDLKVMPGTVPVCHFLGSGAISWVPRNSKATY